MNKKIFFTLIILAAAIGCSQGANSDQANSANSATVAAPTVSYTGSPYTFYSGIAITTQTPSITGSNITSCTVSPALPSGLTLDNTTCAVSGTPTATAAAAAYTVTISNAGGSGTASITITVNNPPAPTISYTGSPYILIMGQAMTSLTPTLTLTGLPVTGCTSSPALPAGLSISNTTCVISGTPTVSADATNHTITVTTSAGSGTATVNILTGKRIFVTATAYTGNLGGISGADTKCTSDSNKPSTGTYKALVSVAAVRQACSNNWCATSAELLDWPVSPQRNYVRADLSVRIAKAGDNGILSPMANSIESSSNVAWTGQFLSYTTASNVSCNSWTSASAAANGYAGDTQSTGSAYYNNISSTCDISRRLYCVEQ